MTTARKTEYPEAHERSAARRYLEHDYAANNLSGRPAHEANQHATAIDEEHPRARDIALTGTRRELGPLPAHLRAHQRRAREQAGITVEQARQIRHAYRSGPHREDEPDETERGFSDRAREHARQARDQVVAGSRHTGHALEAASDAAVQTSWGSLFGQVILTGLGLSILYLFLTRAAAAGKLFQGATTAVRAVVSPVVDPLNPTGALR